MQPRDPVLSVSDTERQTFSLRFERLIMYAIRVQFQPSINSDVTFCDSGLLTHRFGLGLKTSISKVSFWIFIVTIRVFHVFIKVFVLCCDVCCNL
jgi:hypothetical protein